MSCRRSSATFGARPKSAIGMAWISDVLPAPVGPVMANRSSPVKSRSTSSANAVNPLTLTLSGLTHDLLVQSPEELRQCRRQIRAVLAPVVGLQALHGIGGGRGDRRGIGARLRRAVLTPGRLFEPWVLEPHLERVRQDFLHAAGEPRRRRRDVERDTEVRAPEALGARPEFIERSVDVEELPAAREGDVVNLHGTAGMRLDEDHALRLVDFPEVE